MNLRRILRNIIFRIIDSPPQEFSDEEVALEKELKESFKKLPPKSNTAEIHSQWEENLQKLSENIINRPLKDFLRWDVITHTMFATNSSYVLKEFFILKRMKDWHKKWKPLLIETKTGHPIPFVAWPKTSGNRVHQAYNLSRIESILNISVTDIEQIIEFGGGYGLLCTMIYKAGFQGQYLIYDIKEFSYLQKFYLQMNSLPVNSNSKQANSRLIRCITDLEELSLLEKGKKTLFIANWSISEAPVELRNIFINKIKEKVTYIFIAYQSSFRGIDNHRYFHELQNSLKEFKWILTDIPHLGENKYLTGIRQK